MVLFLLVSQKNSDSLRMSDMTFDGGAVGTKCDVRA